MLDTILEKYLVETFVTQCADIGFSAKQLYGSVWRFAPTGDSVIYCSVQLHEPDPNDKITYLVVMHFGRRLSRSFDWSYETFQKA